MKHLHRPLYGPHLPVGHIYHWVLQVIWANGHTVEHWVRVSTPLFRL